MIIYCSLCGVLLEQRSNGQDLLNKRLSWLQEIRAVLAPVTASPSAVTDVGFLDQLSQLVIPSIRNADHADAVEQLEIYTLLPWAWERVIYPFHDACWRLLLSRMNLKDQYNPNQLSENLLNIFHCTPKNRYKALDPDHDYEGAKQVQEPLRDLIQRPIQDRTFLMADPLQPFPLNATVVFTHCINGTPSDLGPTIGISREQKNPSDVFARLPAEIVTLILLQLSSGTVCNLRLSSRSVAAISGPDQLPGYFWESRFGHDQEMGWVFACSSSPSRGTDWRHLYAHAQATLREDFEAPNVKNKHRIWQCLGHVSLILDHAIDAEPVVNDVGRPDVSPVFSESRLIGSVISGEMMTESQWNEHFQFGCRRLKLKSLDCTDISDAEIFDLGVSFVRLKSAQYISGLRFRIPKGDGNPTSCRVTGRIIPSSEEWIQGIAMSDLKRLEVAADISGILGLRLSLEDSGTRGSQIVGDVATCRSGVGIAKFSPPPGASITGISIGFEICKVVSLQLIGDTRRPVHTTTQTQDISSVSSSSGAAFATLWNPNMPSAGATIKSSPQPSVNYTFNLHLNINLSGTRACLLTSLQRIDAIMFDRGEVFLGFELVYAGGYRAFFGRRAMELNRITRPGLNVSFHISSSQGERLSAIDVLHNSSSVRGAVHAIKLFTTWGRSRTLGFGDVEGRRPDRVKSASWTSLNPSNGEIISGFVALTAPFTGVLQTFGIVTTREVENHLPSRPLRLSLPSTLAEDTKTGSYILCKHGIVNSQASLRNIRRIRISHGALGTSRLPQHISGLWIEYYNITAPEIVGQWISEFQCWEFNNEEKVISVRLWSTNEREVLSYGRAKIGNIIGIGIETTSSRFELHLSEACGSVRLIFQANMFEELTEVNWAFSLLHDHVRVLSFPSPHSQGLELVGVTNEPSWIVPERLFWRDCDFKGKTVTVSMIEFHFDNNGISGVSCHYDSGLKRTIGTPARETAVLNFGENEWPAGLDVGYCFFPPNIWSITLYTNHARQLRAHGEKSPERVFKHQLHPSCLIPFRPDSCSGDSVHELPEGVEDFAGFEGATKRVDGSLRRFDPLFLKLRTSTGDLPTSPQAESIT